MAMSFGLTVEVIQFVARIAASSQSICNGESKFHLHDSVGDYTRYPLDFYIITIPDTIT